MPMKVREKEKKLVRARIKETLARAVLVEPDLNQTMRKAKTLRLTLDKR